MSNVSDVFKVSESRLDEICKIIAQIPMEHGLETYINIARGEFINDLHSPSNRNPT